MSEPKEIRMKYGTTSVLFSPPLPDGFLSPGTYTLIVEPPPEEDEVGDLFEREGCLYVLAEHKARFALIVLDKVFLAFLAHGEAYDVCRATWLGWHKTVADASDGNRSEFTKLSPNSPRAKELLAKMLG